MALAANTQSCRIVLWKNFKKFFKNTFKNTFKNAFKNTFENYSTLLETRIIIHILQKISEMVVGNFLSHLDKARFKMLRSQAPKQE